MKTSEIILKIAAGLSGAGLMLVTGIHSYSLLVQTLPPQQHDMAIVALVALEGGIVFWMFAYFHSVNPVKKAIAAIMAVFSFIGVSTAFITDTFHQQTVNAGGKVDTSYMLVALWVASAVILLDIISLALYFHLTDSPSRPTMPARPAPPAGYSVRVEQPQPFPQPRPMQEENPVIGDVPTSRKLPAPVSVSRFKNMVARPKLKARTTPKSK